MQMSKLQGRQIWGQTPIRRSAGTSRRARLLGKVLGTDPNPWERLEPIEVKGCRPFFQIWGQTLGQTPIPRVGVSFGDKFWGQTPIRDKAALAPFGGTGTRSPLFVRVLVLDLRRLDGAWPAYLNIPISLGPIKPSKASSTACRTDLEHDDEHDSPTSESGMSECRPFKKRSRPA